MRGREKSACLRIIPSTGDARFRGVVELPEQGRSLLLPDVDRLLAMTKGEPDRAEVKAKVIISAEPHVLFSGGGGRYALPARSVREILPDLPVEIQSELLAEFHRLVQQ